MYKKAWCTCKVVVLLIKPIVFLTFSLLSASLDLKVPIVYRPTCKFHLSCYPQRDGIIESLQPFQHMSSSRWDESYYKFFVI